MTSLYSSSSEGIWDKPGIPHRGWSYVDVEVLEEANGVCEMCDKTKIRYLHTVSHENWDDLKVGCVCAEKMCEDYVTPKANERAAKSQVERSKRLREEEALEREEADRKRARRALRVQQEEDRTEVIKALRLQELAKSLMDETGAKSGWLDLEKWKLNPSGNYTRDLEGNKITVFRCYKQWKYVYKKETNKAPLYSAPYYSTVETLQASFKEHKLSILNDFCNQVIAEMHILYQE